MIYAIWRICMNKKILAIALVLFVAIGGCFAKGSSGLTGIGLFGSYGGATGYTGGGAGLTLKFGSFPVLGIQYNFYNSYSSLALSCDYYVIDSKAIGGPLTWYLGVGGFAGFAFGNNGNSSSFDMGLRLPIGLQIWPVSKLELYIGAVPTIRFLPSIIPGIGAEVGLRIHL